MHLCIVVVSASLVVVVSTSGALAQREARPDDDALRAAFEQRYERWQVVRREALEGPGSDLDTAKLFGSEAWQRLTQLGVGAVPLFIKKLPHDHMLGHALHNITGWRYHVTRTGASPAEWLWRVAEFPDIQSTGGPPDAVAIWLRWWGEGPEFAAQSFRDLRARWPETATPGRRLLWATETYLDTIHGQLHTQQRQLTPAGEVYDAIQCLGIAVLPHIVETLREGEADFLPIALELTDGAGGLGDPTRPPEVAAFLEWWEANKQDWLIPWPEEPEEP